MNWINCFLLTLILVSCSSELKKKENQRPAPFQGAGAEQFFLPDVPYWANYSYGAQCFKDQGIRVMDFSRLHAIYQLEFSQMQQLQFYLNKSFQEYYKSASLKFLKPIEEANMFKSVLERVKTKSQWWELPIASKSIFLVWFEDLNNSASIDQFKKWLETEAAMTQVTVMISLCAKDDRMQRWIEDQKLIQVGIKTIGVEWLSPYESDLILKPGPRLSISHILGKEIKYQFKRFSKEPIPTEIKLN